MGLFADKRFVLICTGTGSGTADLVLKTSVPDSADPETPDPTRSGSGSATLLFAHRFPNFYLSFFFTFFVFTI